MRLRRVDPKIIKIPEVRVTAEFDEETREQFKKSIKGTGIEEPIICYQVGEDLVLSDGFNRLIEALENDYPKVDIVLREGDMVEVLCKNLRGGHLTGKHPPSQIMKVIEALWKEYQVDIEEIAKRTGMTRDHVEKLIRISELTPLVRQALDEGKLGISHAEILAGIKDPARQEMVLTQLQLYKWSVKEFREYVRQVEQTLVEVAEELEPAVKKRLAKVRCFYCGNEYNLAQIANPNTCVGCSGALLASITQARAELEAEDRAREKAEVPQPQAEGGTEIL